MDKISLTNNLTAERIKKFLSEGKRFDLRKKDEFREIIVETGISINAEGSARVKIGNTEVVVGVKMDIGTPYADAQDKGNLMTTAELLPLSSPRFESGPPKFPAIELGRVIDRVIRESKIIDFKKLCIKEGEKVWTIFVDIYSINDDGNLLDAAGLGAMVALRNAKIPKYDSEKGKVLYGNWTEEKIALANHNPLSITVYKIGNNFIVDPTREEEDISDARLTIGLSEQGIHSMQKGNKEELTIEEMQEILDLAEKARESVFKKIKNYLK